MRQLQVWTKHHRTADVPHITTYHHYSPLKNPWSNPWFTQFPQRWADRIRSRLSEWTRSDVLHVAFVRVQLLTQIHDRLHGSNGGVFQCQAIARGYNLLQDTNRNFLPSRGNGFHADFPPPNLRPWFLKWFQQGVKRLSWSWRCPPLKPLHQNYHE